ncbi:hypothetical protein [Ammoniphilus sp. CFH 90114]|uniref:hypothetical protein n=1 Tax=Ammoniphilus sp. CFH 90114 TaxID=2493665 RepID=UPI00100ED6C3|nr:hypothetical protein [Ammoniphilus sp. CFH 90114]RXT03598.1 hypothetical protein EIZ39_23500 [Ammoniphilus sp. CFH 90114]
MSKKKVEIDIMLEQDKTWDVEVYYLEANEWVLDEDLSDAHFQTKDAALRYVDDLKKNPKIEISKVTERK